MQILALQTLREIAREIKKAVHYTIMADETADVSNKEQVVVCIRWIDEDLNANEQFIGMKYVSGADAESLVYIIKVN